MSYDPFMSKALELQEERIKFQHELANANATIEVAMARVEALEAENTGLREALKPFAAIANLNGFPNGIDVTLWRRSTNEPGVEDILIKLSDCKKAYEALANANP